MNNHASLYELLNQRKHPFLSVFLEALTNVNTLCVFCFLIGEVLGFLSQQMGVDTYLLGSAETMQHIDKLQEFLASRYTKPEYIGLNTKPPRGGIRVKGSTLVDYITSDHLFVKHVVFFGRDSNLLVHVVRVQCTRHCQ